MEWAAPRYENLVTPAAMDGLLKRARERLAETARAWSVEPVSVGLVDSWYIMVSVYPSSSDQDFVSACPRRSYEALAEQVRARLRTTVPAWDRLDFAHWLLLGSR